MDVQIIIIVIAAIVVTGGASAKIASSVAISNKIKKDKIEEDNAGTKAEKIIKTAEKEAVTLKKEALIEAKDEVFKLKIENEKEIKERRGEVSQQERRLISKEESLDKKIDNLEAKEQKLAEKEKLVVVKTDEIEELKQEQINVLEKISGYTMQTAKDYLLGELDKELVHEKAVKINAFHQNINLDLDLKAKTMLSQVISRCASDHVAEVSVSVVNLPNDEMKGRIIGREGRNIRTLETLTGVDLIIDDTPEAITVSSFDPVRREIAKQAIEKLIEDGRIHPTRIEEMVEKATNSVGEIIKKEGERAVLETGIHPIHPELVKLIGRLKFRTSYGQNILNHSLEVAHLSGLLANELGVDPVMARRAGLLHDIGKAIDHEVEGTHISIGLDIAKKYKEPDEVVLAIHSHHGTVEASTITACIVKAADAISAARPGARREDLENYIKRLERLEEIANSFDGVEKSFAIQAGREVRILVNPDNVSDDEMTLIARNIVNQIENELNYPGQIKVHIIRESRAIEFAK